MDKIHNTITYYGRGGCYETDKAQDRSGKKR